MDATAQFATVDHVEGDEIGHYDRDGDIKTGGLPLETPSDRETARQARMKREG